MIDPEDDTVVRLITEDAQLLLPALLARGASFRLSGRRRIDVRGMGAADVARIAALCEARVVGLELVGSGGSAYLP
ncbi:hypothetical protein ACFFGH_33460 [Lysobacter korlensis]|uniref:STAS domain-containing protein n=1 Tax=Lysobacter korlensis TaxID=553636 RepID=A0ABV6S0L0_9GAMM